MDISVVPTNLESISNPAGSTKPATAPESDSFGGLLKQSLNDVNELQQKADQAVSELATGQQQDIHNTMIAMEKADVAFRLLMQIRNKVIAAYETVMRMQV